MYYYIIESAGKKSEVWQEKVKSILGDIGIAGETVTPSPARTVEELASLGIVKGYSTIVAVGSEKTANKIATAIINRHENNDVVLGVIPENYDTAIARKIRVKDLKHACETLKYRKLEVADACFIEPNKYFLTEATIDTIKTVDAYLKTDSIQAGFSFNRILIKPGLTVNVEDSSGGNTNKSIFNWLLGKKKVSNDIHSSLFHDKKFKLETPGFSLPIISDGEIIAKTPIILQNRPKVLKIIIARDTIALDNDNH